MHSADEIIDRCRAAGMRVTAQRRAIFEELEGNRSHPTAEEVYRAVRRRAKGTSLATVYNTLDALQALGEIGRHRLDGGGDRFDPEVRPHHHFRCNLCGKVADAFGEVHTPALSGLAGYEIERVEMVLSGRCESCCSKRTGGHLKQAHQHQRRAT